MKHIMLDLETMGTGNNAAIVAIGACSFDPHSEGVPIGIGNNFYGRVSLQSSMAAGMQVDPSTILWWMQQSEAARKSTFEGDSWELHAALQQFNAWVKENKGEFVWGNGATFDNVIIRAACRATFITPAWHFRGDKCYRTVINLLPKERQPAFERSGTAHNALDDAITQAVYLQKVWKELGL